MTGGEITFTLDSYPVNFIKYLGTGGARFSMVQQARATGGIWFRYGGLSGVIDPGPGSLVHMRAAVPELDPHLLRAILLSHKHLDHSVDINVVAEAMTGGGFEKQGTVVLTEDSAYGDDPVLLKYMARKVGQVCICRDGEPIMLENGVTVEPVAHIHHGVDCFGWIFSKPRLTSWGVISDSRPLEQFAERYRECGYMSINTTFPDKKPHLDHMAIEDAGELLDRLHPKLATLTHFGMMILQGSPDEFARRIEKKETRVIAARDGMIINLDTLQVIAPVADTTHEARYGIV